MKHQQIPTTNVAKSWVVSYKTGSQTCQGRTVRKKVPITWAAKFTKGKLETRGSLGKISIVIKEMQIKTVVARDERILDAELELIGVIYSEDNLAIHTKGSKFTSAISRNHPWKIIRDAQTEVPIWVHCICAYNQWKLAVTSVFCNRASLEEMIACATAGFFFFNRDWMEVTGYRSASSLIPKYLELTNKSFEGKKSTNSSGRSSAGRVFAEFLGHGKEETDSQVTKTRKKHLRHTPES